MLVETSLSEHLQVLIHNIRLVAFDFDGVFTDNMVYVSEDGTESVRCSRSDGLGLRKLEQLGVTTFIISTETNSVVSVRARKLNVRCIQSSQDKRQTLENLAADIGISLQQIAFVGNDINDLSALLCVGLPVVVQDSHPDVLPHAIYRTRALGGHGAVREICDLFDRVLNTESLHRES